MSYEYVETKWLSQVIVGKITFRKCPNCDLQGIELQSYDDEGNPCQSDHEWAMRDTCENCRGLAFIENPS